MCVWGEIERERHTETDRQTERGRGGDIFFRGRGLGGGGVLMQIYTLRISNNFIARLCIVLSFSLTYCPL